MRCSSRLVICLLDISCQSKRGYTDTRNVCHDGEPLSSPVTDWWRRWRLRRSSGDGSSLSLFVSLPARPSRCGLWSLSDSPPLQHAAQTAATTPPARRCRNDSCTCERASSARFQPSLRLPQVAKLHGALHRTGEGVRGGETWRGMAEHERSAARRGRGRLFHARGRPRSLRNTPAISRTLVPRAAQSLRLADKRRTPILQKCQSHGTLIPLGSTYTYRNACASELSAVP